MNLSALTVIYNRDKCCDFLRCEMSKFTKISVSLRKWNFRIRKNVTRIKNLVSNSVLKIRFNVKSRPISIWKFQNRTKCRFLKEHKSVKFVPSIDLTTVRHLNHHLTRRNFSIFESLSFLLYLISSPIGTFLELKNHKLFFKLRYHYFFKPILEIMKNFFFSMEPGTTVIGPGWTHDSWLLIDDWYSTFCSRKWCNMNESPEIESH